MNILSSSQEAGSGLLRMKEGSLYPALYRLEVAGKIKAAWSLNRTLERVTRSSYLRPHPQGKARISPSPNGMGKLCSKKSSARSWQPRMNDDILNTLMARSSGLCARSEQPWPESGKCERNCSPMSLRSLRRKTRSPAAVKSLLNGQGNALAILWSFPRNCNEASRRGTV